MLANFQPFRKLNINALIVELDGRKDGNEIQAVLGEMTGARTVNFAYSIHKT